MKTNIFTLSKKVALAVVLLFFLIQFTEAQFVLSGELRPRAEYRHGYKTLASDDVDPAAFVSQRTRLNFVYAEKRLKFKLSLQDIRVWGNTAQLNMTDDYYSVHEAWGELVTKSGLSFKLGRQELAYDDHRIFGNVGWAQQSRSHDLALLKFEKNKIVNIHIGAAFNQESEQLFQTIYNNPKNYKSMQFVWLHKNWKGQGISFLFLNNGLQYFDPFSGYSVKYSQTLGSYINLKKGKVSLNASGYYQMGKDNKDKDLSAFMYSTDLSIALVKKTKISLGYQILSGTDQLDISDPDYEKNLSFTPLYGTNHKFNGHMDYFYVGNHVNNVGLRDLYLRIDHKPGKMTFTGFVHKFNSFAELLDPENPGETMKKNLGFEVDLSAAYDFSNNVNIALGYSQMFGTNTMEVLKGGDMNQTNNWIWLMLSFKPEFLKHN